MSGRFIAVVGPSGVGKDSVIDALCARRPDITRVRRVITREAEAGGEDYEPVSEESFAASVSAGAFALHWAAHGLHYGIPFSVTAALRSGDVLANLSRGVLSRARTVFGTVHVLHVTADPQVLADRLQGRGRESHEEIARRLARLAPAFPDGLDIIEIDNSGSLDAAVDAACAALYPVNA